MPKTIAITLMLLALMVPLAGAQDVTDCGFQYEVVRGDSLYLIAQRCGVTVEDIRELNPGVTNLLQPGDLLTLPDRALNPAVSITPRNVNGVTTVTVSASGFQPEATVRVGVGLPGEVALDATTAVTNADGAASATLTVPADIALNTQLYVTAASIDNALQATSEPFTIARAARTNPDNTGNLTSAPATDDGIGGGDTAPAAELISPNYARLAPSPAPVRVNVNGAVFESVIIYLVREGDNGQSGIAAACNDSLVPVQVSIPATVAPLTASIDALLRNTGDELDLPTLQNPAAVQVLRVDQINISNAQAHINLTGTILTGTSFCDRARLINQIEATALQYATVDRVVIRVNGELLQ